MRIIFSIFVFGVLSSSAMAELVCERVSGCALFPEAKTESEYCPTCVSPTPELTKVTSNGNMCIEKFEDCVSTALKKNRRTYLCERIKSECEAMNR